MASTSRRSHPPRRLILDSGAVLALAQGKNGARALLARALELDAPVEIPVVVVAETVRGTARDAPVHRVLKAVGSVPDAQEEHGRLAGQLLGDTGSSSTIDAFVVAQAIKAGGAHILTGDLDDLDRLAQRHPEVWIQKV